MKLCRPCGPARLGADHEAGWARMGARGQSDGKPRVGNGRSAAAQQQPRPAQPANTNRAPVDPTVFVTIRSRPLLFATLKSVRDFPTQNDSDFIIFSLSLCAAHS